MRILKTYENFTDNGVKIRPMLESDVNKCLDMKFQYFGHFYGDLSDPKAKEQHDRYALNKLDLSVSLVAEVNGEVVGGYILRKTKFPNYPGNFYDFSGDDSTGVEGVSLFVHPDYKGKGVGHMLKYYYKENKRPDVNFIWGQAFHGLKNINHWLKTRTLFNDMYGVYYTIELYNGDINKYPKTESLNFYQTNKKSVVDYIYEMHREGRDIEDIQNDDILSGFDKTEIMNIYSKLF